MLVNDVSLRNLIPAELAKGFGFFHGKPSTAFSPVAVTPDELGPAWADGKVHLPLLASINGKLLGRPNAGVDMTFSFPQLIAHAAKTRRLGAGTIIGSGTVSNKDDGGPGKPVEQGGAGYTCLAELRTVETLPHRRRPRNVLRPARVVRHADRFEPIHMLHKMPFPEIMRLSILGNAERLSAARAYDIGLVSEVVPASELHERARWAAETTRRIRRSRCRDDPCAVGGAQPGSQASARHRVHVDRGGYRRRGPARGSGVVRVGQAPGMEVAMRLFRPQ